MYYYSKKLNEVARPARPVVAVAVAAVAVAEQEYMYYI
jgi:hypothetical protein